MANPEPAASPIPNPYKAALARALTSAQPVAADCGTALDGAIASMQGQAWVSPLAQEFVNGLIAQDRSATDAGHHSVEELRRAHDAQTDKVEPGAWQLHWRNL